MGPKMPKLACMAQKNGTLCTFISLAFSLFQRKTFNGHTLKLVYNGHSQKEQKFQDQLSFNAGQKYCRMLHGEHSAILSTFIKLPFAIKIFVLSNFEWPFLHRFYCI